MFQSTPSGGKATPDCSFVFSVCQFQSTPSGGKATGAIPRQRLSVLFQSTPSGGKATLQVGQTADPIVVSIHAFRGEGDINRQRRSAGQRSFNPRLPGGRRPPSARLARAARHVSIHAFRGEGDSICAPPGVSASVFQSTPSGGKATAISRAAVPCSHQIL